MPNIEVKRRQKKTLLVVAGLLADQQGRYLLSQRQAFQDHPFCWEFPGGKVEENETLQQALTREILEETDIRVERCQPFKNVCWEYDNKKVNLHFYLVTEYKGLATGKEGQVLAWHATEKMHQLIVPEANRVIIAALQDKHNIRT